MPADETVRWVIAPFTLLVFTAHNLLIVRKLSIRQIFERLLDFVVLQFDTPLECKKAGTFDFSKVPALPICLFFLTCAVYIILKIASENENAPER